jgi:glycine cleavage system aminomethyltransferase T
MIAQGAVMGDSWGLETPLWFAPKGVAPKDIFSFHRSNDFKHVKAEVLATRNGVGVTEIANFAKYRFTGAGAEAFLSRLMTNKMPKPGRLILTPMLNPQGRLIGDFTIAKAKDECFYMWGSSQAQKYHMRWFEQHLPADGSVNPSLRHGSGRPLHRRSQVARRLAAAHRRGRLQRRLQVHGSPVDGCGQLPRPHQPRHLYGRSRL